MSVKLVGWLIYPAGPSPRGICLLWDPGLVWTYAGADAGIALAYFAIPLTLANFARRRPEPIFPAMRLIVWLFAGFIMLCGAVHLLDVLTIWVPAYGLEAIVKIATAFFSIMTAAALWWRLPDLVALPSPAQLGRANSALRESEGRYRASFEQSPIPMHTLSENGVLTGVSRSWETLLGYTGHEVIGRHITEFQPFGATGQVEADWAKLTEDGEVHDLERRYVHRSGVVMDVLMSVRLEHQDRAARIVCVLIDVTERRRTEEALRSSEERLHQAQKMEAVGQLTGGIAHDFNNFLQSITGSLDVIERRIAQGRTTEAKRYVEIARAAANAAAILTNRMLAFARRQALQPAVISPDVLVRGMIDLIHSGMGPAVRLELNLHSGLSVVCDANQLESALLNLTINAREAMPAGGTVTISTHEQMLTAADLADHDALQPGGYVEIAVTDTGAGMDPEVVRRAFEPFFSTRPFGHGTGLGLSQVYGFVLQSGGFVRLESKLGYGTTVRLYLPGKDYPVAEIDGTANNHVPPPLGGSIASTTPGLTVLVVEDEDRIRNMIVALLDEQGYSVLEAEDGPSGLRIVQSAVRMDLLLTDVGLPGLNGRQLADAARTSRPNLPVLFITGYTGRALDDNRLPPGMQILHKPFALDTLIARVRILINSSSAIMG